MTETKRADDARPTGVVGGDGVTIYRELAQRSPEWYAARCGIVTASAMNALITVAAPDATAVDCPDCDAEIGGPCLALGRKTPTAIKTYHPSRVAIAASLPAEYVPADNETSRGLIMTLAAERITGHVEETPTTGDMWRGIESEPYAREIYATDIATEPVDEIGFAVRDFGGFKIGFSPDGLVGDNGLIEIKAPRQKGHLSTVVSGEVPAHHMAQLQTGLLVMGWEWIDFVSYCGGMHLWPKRVTPDPRWQTAILAAAKKAEDAIAETVAAYEQAVVGLPLTKRIDFNAVELKLA